MTPDLWFQLCMWPAFVLYLLVVASMVELDCQRHEAAPRCTVTNVSLLFGEE